MPSNAFVAFDPLALLSALRDVEYLVVGGFAAVLYGAPTVTSDLDIMPSSPEANVACLAAVLARLHAVVREPRSSGRKLAVTIDLLRHTAQSGRLGGQLRTRTDAGPLDVLWQLHDGRGYQDLVDQSSVLTEEELCVRVIGLDDLIDVKASINRPQDRAAVPYLRKIRQRTQG